MKRLVGWKAAALGLCGLCTLGTAEVQAVRAATGSDASVQQVWAWEAWRLAVQEAVTASRATVESDAPRNGPAFACREGSIEAAAGACNAVDAGDDEAAPSAGPDAATAETPPTCGTLLVMRARLLERVREEPDLIDADTPQELIIHYEELSARLRQALGDAQHQSCLELAAAPSCEEIMTRLATVLDEMLATPYWHRYAALPSVRAVADINQRLLAADCPLFELDL